MLSEPRYPSACSRQIRSRRALNGGVAEEEALHRLPRGTSFVVAPTLALCLAKFSEHLLLAVGVNFCYGSNPQTRALWLLASKFKKDSVQNQKPPTYPERVSNQNTGRRHSHGTMGDRARPVI